MAEIKTDFVLDAKGLACPMPIVKTKKAMNDLEPGQVIEIQATDKGSKADIKAWAENTGHQYIGTLEEEGLLKHYIRKASAQCEKTPDQYPHVVTNEELEAVLGTDGTIVIDVREEAEYVFGHIPNSISIPLGDIESRLSELDKSKKIYVVCRSGNRRDMSEIKLVENGFSDVINVVPGMSGWNGPIEA